MTARVLHAIEQARTRAVELETERARELVRIAALEAELAAVDSHASIVHEPQPVAEGARRSSAAKLEIFRGLFRGRTDVYPTRFESKKGKAGYAPACNNSSFRGSASCRR